MKKKITLQLSSGIIDRLKATAEERGVNRAIVVEKALARYLIEAADPLNVPPDHLARMEEQLQSIQRELKAVNETVGLHARYHLAWTSLQQRPSEEPSRGSSYASADRAAEPTTEMNRRHVSTESNLVDDGSADLPFGAPRRRAANQSRGSVMTDVCWGLPAGQEGGSEDPFHFSPMQPLR
jgi:hypothetical protein